MSKIYGISEGYFVQPFISPRIGLNFRQLSSCDTIIPDLRLVKNNFICVSSGQNEWYVRTL